MMKNSLRSSAYTSTDADMQKVELRGNQNAPVHAQFEVDMPPRVREQLVLVVAGRLLDQATILSGIWVSKNACEAIAESKV